MPSLDESAAYSCNLFSRASSRRDPVDRIGLSATLGDMRLAADFLRPGGGDSVQLVEGTDAGNGLKLQIRAYASPRSLVPAPDARVAVPLHGVVNAAVVDDLFRVLRGAAISSSRAHVTNDGQGDVASIQSGDVDRVVAHAVGRYNFEFARELYYARSTWTAYRRVTAHRLLAASSAASHA